ncbi:MAG: HXXEE domain-containing protein [Myxococcota bacterium]
MPSWAWLLPGAYTLHIADEFFVGVGFYRWVGEFVPLGAASFLGVNIMIVSLIVIAVALGTRVHSCRFLLVAVLTQFTIHGLLVHPPFSIWRGEWSPGLVSGLGLLLPLAALGGAWAIRNLPGSRLAGGVAAGVLLFASQDLWRVLFNWVFAPSA